MDYKFLANKEIERFFEETNFSVGEIFLSIISKNNTGIEITNRSRFTELTDQEWYGIIEKSLADSLEEDPKLSEEEFKNTIDKIFTNER